MRAALYESLPHVAYTRCALLTPEARLQLMFWGTRQYPARDGLPRLGCERLLSLVEQVPRRLKARHEAGMRPAFCPEEEQRRQL